MVVSIMHLARFSVLGFAMACFPLLSASAADALPGSSSYRSKAPIEITSDSLEVLQQEHKAIFTGHVVAVQGDVRMRSEIMTVFYKNQEQDNAKAKAPIPAAATSAAPEKQKTKKAAANTSADAQKNAIQKILVEGGVFLTTPQETASGTHGVYDVENHRIFLNDNVVLTRDKNVLKGDRLVYDFTTGKSELNTADTTSNTGGTDSGKPKGRVKALFIPGGDEKSSFKQ